MTLNVSPTEIKINNSSGVTKFTSSDKLVYRKAVKTNTLTFSAGLRNFDHGLVIDQNEQWWYYRGTKIIEPFQALGSKDFLIMTFRFNSCSSTIGQSLVGPTVLAGGPIIIDYSTVQWSQVFFTDQEILTWGLTGSDLFFSPVRYIYNIGGGYYHTSSSLGLTYTATIYSYL